MDDSQWRRDNPLYWEHEGNRAIRIGDWKLVSQHPGGWELYNMLEDRTELNDLSAGESTRVAEMSALYDAWAQRCEVPRLAPRVGSPMGRSVPPRAKPSPR